MNNQFIIIVPFYNVEKWIKYNIRSVKKQDYKNFKCILIDDISTDNSVAVVKKEIVGDERFILIENTEKKYALQNIVDAIQLVNADQEDVIVTLDGDDWLHSSEVLGHLNNVYTKEECWITYGSYVEYPNGNIGKFAKQIPKEIILNNTFRESSWTASHLRTFKFHLWDKIKPEDLLDSEGGFYQMAWDLAFMFPMLEMAGNKSQYINEPLYVYNISNPLNDHKVDNTYQIQLESEIRNKQKYKRLSAKSNASGLMAWNRFDIAAKTFLADTFKKKINVKFAKEMYFEHLKVWNNFNELHPPKNTKKDFLDSFIETYSNIEKNDFDESHGKIPTFNNLAINGAHRIASCIILNKELKTAAAPTEAGQFDCTSTYFKDKTNFVDGGLSEVYCDEMALEFCRRKDNLFTISLFPSHGVHHDQLIDIVSNNANVIYCKKIELSKNGSFNYISNLYYGESWVGPKTHGYPGVKEKTNLCFSRGQDLHVLLVEEDNINNLVLLKDELRRICNVGKHSIHINDTQEETWRIASSVFNENSVHFLNNAKLISDVPNFESYFKTFTNLISNRQDKHDFCIDASAVLSSYGLRDCRDLDFLHVDDNLKIAPGINCHNEEERYYHQNRFDIIFNPRNHFYYSGIKFASLDTMIRMKESRGEEKDKVDVRLMREML